MRQTGNERGGELKRAGDGENIAGKWQTDETSVGLESYLRHTHTHTHIVENTHHIYNIYIVYYMSYNASII